jgi:hypothetical protein
MSTKVKAYWITKTGGPVLIATACTSQTVSSVRTATVTAADRMARSVSGMARLEPVTKQMLCRRIFVAPPTTARRAAPISTDYTRPTREDV